MSINDLKMMLCMSMSKCNNGVILILIGLDMLTLCIFVLFFIVHKGPIGRVGLPIGLPKIVILLFQ